MKKISKKIIVSVTTAAFLSIAGVGVWAYAAPYSYVSLDVNPSIEYTLNVFDRVIDVEAVNDDGQEILENAGDLKNLTIEEAITKTVDELAEEGYIMTTTAETTGTDVTETVSGAAVEADGSAEAVQETGSETPVTEGVTTETGTTVEATTGDSTTTETTTGTAITTETTTGTAITTGDSTTDTTTTTDNTDGANDIIVGGIVITVSNKDIELNDELVNKIRDAVESVISEEVEVDVMGVGYARVQEARKLGVTPGKLNLVEKLKASSSDPDSIVVSEWVKKPVKDIMQATKENRKAQIFSTSSQSEETSEAANDSTAVGTVSGSAVASNSEDSNNASEVNQNTGIIKNEDADDQGEDDNEDADDQGEDDNDDSKDIRKEAYKAVKKAEKEAKKDAMEAAKEDSKSYKEESREAKKKADEAAKEAKKLAKETEKKAKEELSEAEEEAREAAEKAREASEDIMEEAADEDNKSVKDKKENYGSVRSAEKGNNQNNKGNR